MNNKEKILFLASLGICSFFLAAASISTVKQKPMMIGISSFISWWGYLFAHKISEGTFIDGEGISKQEKNTMIPRSTQKWAGALAGSGILISGMLYGVIGLRSQNILNTFLAASLFISGYVIAHYSTTKELL